MKDIFKKILISLTAFILVLSFSFTHLNTSKRFEVNATEYTPTNLDKAKLMAGIMAGLGIKFVQDLSDSTVTAVYNGLNAGAKAVVDGFDYQNQIIGDYLAIGYNEAQTLIKSLYDTFGALTAGSTGYLGNDGVYNFHKETYTNPTSFGINTYGVLGSTAYIASVNQNVLYQKQTMSMDSSKRIYNYVEVYPAATCSFETEIGWFLSSLFIDSPSTDGKHRLGVRLKSNCNVYAGGQFRSGEGIVLKARNSLGNILDVVMPAGLVATQVSVDAGGLTLAPPPGGDWNDDDDVDIPAIWTKVVNWADNLSTPAKIVIGGIGGTTLSELALSLINNPVLLPPATVTPFDPVVPVEPVDPFPNPADPTNIGSWLLDGLKALGLTMATAFGLHLDPVGSAISGIQTFLDSIVENMVAGFQVMLEALIQPLVSAFSEMIQGLFTLDLPATKLKIEGIRSAIFARIPCVQETLNAWYQIMAVNGSNLISSFTFFGETFSISSGTLLQAFQGFGSMIKQAFRFVFWFIFLKGMRRRVTSFLGLVSAER
jgi:hypothetical protein